MVLVGIGSGRSWNARTAPKRAAVVKVEALASHRKVVLASPERPTVGPPLRMTRRPGEG